VIIQKIHYKEQYEIFNYRFLCAYHLDFILGACMKLYGKTLWFKRGAMLNINLLYECNLACTYCSLEMPTGIRPKAKRVGLDDWKNFITYFTSKNKIREVYVSGGEPSLVKYMPELVNWLIGKGFHVALFSNLYNPDRILQINKSYRFNLSLQSVQTQT
jgi:molybdenum cofactor biosynthesis enzyme MoaA